MKNRDWIVSILGVLKYISHKSVYVYQNGGDLDPSMFNPSGTKGGPGNVKLYFSLNYLLQLWFITFTNLILSSLANLIQVNKSGCLWSNINFNINKIIAIDFQNVPSFEIRLVRSW